MDRKEILRVRDERLKHLKSIYADKAESIIADSRYGFIGGLLKDVLKKPPVERRILSDMIDSVVMNRWLGIPLFLAIMYGMFQFIFALSAPLMNWIDTGFGWVTGYASGVGGWFGSLLADGVIGGVGSVLTFIPPIFLLFIAIAILEDCGYMARAAFIMDRVMHGIGLHGRSFIPMILGFGCNIPGIMATRTIENPRDRLTTILIIPFMSCGGRIPIFVLLAGYFFAGHAGLVIFCMYVTGIMVAVIVALVFRRTLFRGASGHFVMELPPYRRPTIRGVLVHTWERGRLFLERAGTIIFGAVILVWFLNYTGVLEPVGRAIAPVFVPSGFGQWQAAVSLLFGFLAKEAVVGTMGTLFATQEGILGSAIASQLGWTPLVALAFMVFCLLYVPCVACISVIWGETRAWKWPLFAVFYTSAIAWIVATLVFQIGRLLLS